MSGTNQPHGSRYKFNRVCFGVSIGWFHKQSWLGAGAGRTCAVTAITVTSMADG